MTTEPDTKEPISERLAEGLAKVAAGATRVAAEALAGLPPVHCQQIRQAIDAGKCALTLQIDLPSMDIRVLADGEGWLTPQCLFAVEWKGERVQPTAEH